MGLLSKIKDKATSFVNTIGNFIKSGSLVVNNTVTWIKEKILGLGQTPSYNYQTSSIDETKIINQLLEKCIVGYGNQAKEYEQLAKDILNEYLIKIDESLEPFKQGDIVLPNYVFKLLSEESRILSHGVDNLFYDNIAKVFSFNNNNLLDILRLEAGKEKEEMLEKLAKETLESTYSFFIEKIKEFLKFQGDCINNELNNFKKHQEEEGKNIENSLKEIQNKIKNNFDMTKDIRNLEIRKQKLERILV